MSYFEVKRRRAGEGREKKKWFISNGPGAALLIKLLCHLLYTWERWFTLLHLLHSAHWLAHSVELTAYQVLLPFILLHSSGRHFFPLSSQLNFFLSCSFNRIVCFATLTSSWPRNRVKKTNLETERPSNCKEPRLTRHTQWHLVSPPFHGYSWYFFHETVNLFNWSVDCRRKARDLITSFLSVHTSSDNVAVHTVTRERWSRHKFIFMMKCDSPFQREAQS